MKGYTARVGLRKPRKSPAIGLLQVLSDEQAAQVRKHGVQARWWREVPVAELESEAT